MIPKHLGRCGLMLKGLAQFRVAFLDLLEQPHVFDGNHGLVGESFEKTDLFFRERSNFRATNEDNADGNTLAKQRWATMQCERP